MPTAYLLTGEPQSGKTTVIKQLIDRIGKERCGGFYTEEIRVHGMRQGFRLITLEGEQKILAHIKSSSPVRLGRYGVNVACLESLGIPALIQTFQTKRLIILDEIGPMEILSEPFKQTVVEILRVGYPLLGTIALKTHPFLDWVKRQDSVSLHHVTRTNQNEIISMLTPLLYMIVANIPN
ncbi:MAG TPA: nucleoside-triphosphatase [Ktedonobacteraceae bacterium]|jgi:nucleoside-triphosphatase|nr:nucleoside-triphosphatase [Ktedonobacteraceae bacterium]